MLEKKLWEMADELRANSKLRSSEYSVPVLGLIFLRFADQKFAEAEQQLKNALPAGSRRRAIGRADFHELGALSPTGRAGFVMANSAADARGSEAQIRRQLIQSGIVDVMVAIGPNFFYTVTLPCTLWFLDRGKIRTERKDTVLFIDARHIYQQVTRALREFTPAQVEFLANIVRLYRGETPETTQCSSELVAQHFPDGGYQDVAGLCKVATLKEIEAQGWSLNPGRYVGVAARTADEFIFAERLEELNEELEWLNAEARELEERISENVERLLEQNSVAYE